MTETLPNQEEIQLAYLEEIKRRIENHKTHNALLKLMDLVPRQAKPILDAWENIDIDVHQQRLTEAQAKNEYAILADKAIGLIDALMVKNNY